MNTKLKAPCWVTHRQTGAVLRCRAITLPNRRMLSTGWKGLVCHVQNHKGTGIGQYRDFRASTQAELVHFNTHIKRTFGL